MAWVRGNFCAVGLAGLAAVLAAVLSGCGMPGSPLPPSLNLPVQVKDLAATRTGERVRLTWTMPTKNTDKLLLKGEVQVRVWRKQAEAQDCTPVGTLLKETLARYHCFSSFDLS